jgi:hypothetical protein
VFTSHEAGALKPSPRAARLALADAIRVHSTQLSTLQSTPIVSQPSLQSSSAVSWVHVGDAPEDAAFAATFPSAATFTVAALSVESGRVTPDINIAEGRNTMHAASSSWCAFHKISALKPAPPAAALRAVPAVAPEAEQPQVGGVTALGLQRFLASL